MIIKEILERRSIRAYKPDPVSDDTITEIIKAAEFAPSGRHIRPLEYVIVRNAKTKKKLFEIFSDQFLLDAPVLILPIADTSKSTLCIQDASIASGYIFLQAKAHGLGTVWKNVSPDLAEKAKSLLGIPGKYALINIIPLGYATEEVPPHTDGEFETEKIHSEKF